MYNDQDEPLQPDPDARPSKSDAMLRYRVMAELERLDQFIVDCGLRIAEQRLRLEWVKQSGRDAGDSETLLSNLVGSLGALHQLRKTVMSELQAASR